MGVFARLFRRSKATEKVQATEAQADPPAVGPEAQEAAETAGTAEAKGSAEGAEDAVEPAAKATEVTGVTDNNEAVEIPKQQSTEKAADNEVGEGART